MTTLTEPVAPSVPPVDPRPDVPSSRFSRWRASWSVALRMARRDVRRHKGRAVLVFVMVALPVGLLVGTLTFATSSSVSGVERIPVSLGAAQAMLQGPGDTVVWQTADPEDGYSTQGDTSPPKATALPGFDASRSPGSEENVAAVQRLTGGTVLAVGELTMRRVVDEKRSRTAVVTTADLARADLGSKAKLVSGRWATSADEVVATSYGVSRGFPRSGSVELRYEGRPHTVTVVGVADYFNGWGGQPDAVSARPLDPEATLDWQYLVLRDRGVPYSEVKQLNAFGFRVTSAETLRHPPTRAQLPPEILQGSDYASRDVQTLVAVGGVLLLLVTTLLVAPAFAVSASRQRRTLALAASNGAETRQLRRQVLATALVLGALSAVVAAGLALLAVRVVMWVYVARKPWTSFRFFDVSIWAVAAVIAMAVVSTLVAALIPSMRLGRLDIIGVMKGQSVSPRLNRVLPVLGAVLAVGGGVGLVAAVATDQREVAIAGLAVVLVLGALLLVPLLLVAAGALASRLPVPVRLATRDSARHRARSVPTVAAIMAGGVALTAFSIGLVSDTEQQRREYTPQLLAGDGIVYLPSDRATGPSADDVSGTRQVVRGLTPDLAVTPLGQVTAPYDPQHPDAPAAFVTAVKPGCAVAKAVQDDDFDANGQPRCQVVGTNGQRWIAVLDADEIARQAGLDAEAKAVLDRGGVLVPDRVLLDRGSLRVASGTAATEPTAGRLDQVTVERTDTLPAVVGALTIQLQYGAAVTPQTAQRLGWPVTTGNLLLHDPDGAISAADEKALDEVLGEEGGVYVERGFQRDDALVMGILFGSFALLLLIVTLISTALALAEQQTDLGTLAAVGATRGTRRWMAAAQAATVAFLGALAGIAVGLAPGIAVTYPLTTQGWDPVTGMQLHRDPITIIPWLPLGLVLVGVPLVAALLSAAAIRRAPVMTRRAD